MSTIDQLFSTFNNFFEKFVFFNINPSSTIQVPFIVGLMVFGCIYFGIKLKFIHIRYIVYAFKLAFGDHGHDKNDKNSISAWKILFAEISGSVGLGCTAGVAIAVSVGGPGAIV